MSALFDSVWSKIDWGRKRTDELADMIAGFAASSPFEIEKLGDPFHGIGSYRVKGYPRLITEDVPLIAGDAAHSIRAALDHFAYSAVSKPTRRTAFPVWRDPAPPPPSKWARVVNDKLRGASPALIETVTGLQPYRTGTEDYVWFVDDLDVVDKHRLLIAIAGVNTSVIIDFGESLRNSLPAVDTRAVPSMPLRLPVAQWEPLLPGAELFRSEAEHGLRTEPSFEFQIVLGEPEQLSGHLIIDALHDLANRVEVLLRQLVELA